MQSAFRGRSLANLASKTADMFDRFLVAANAGEAVELVEAFARGAASMTTTELLGTTEAETLRLDPVLRKLGALDFADSAHSNLPQREKTELWLLRELTRIVRAHRGAEQSGGVIERLLATEVEGRPLTEHEVALNCLNVVLAGTGATQHTLAGAIAIWASHRSSLDQVGRQPALASGLVDETLRWLTPVVHLTRIVTADTEVSAQQVPRGAGVCLWNVSANRDEEVFEDPGTFRPERPPRRHLAFGAGPQHCLGAQLVRTQLGVLLEGILRHGVRFELDGPAAWARSNTITGIEQLPLRVRRVDPADVQIVDAEAALSGSARRTKGDSCPSP
jgi:cytochrome P450